MSNLAAFYGYKTHSAIHWVTAIRYWYEHKNVWPCCWDRPYNT